MYIPHSESDRKAMLAKIGVASEDELFESIPPAIRFEKSLDIPPALSEMELERHMRALSAKTQAADSTLCFLGGGCYDHFIPAVVDVVASRSEFYTAYTPYQAEASQGTLQVGFEFQSLICELTGMDIANASLYEGGTATAEACLMARAIGDRIGNVVVSETVHPEYRQVLDTYFKCLGIELRTAPHANGVTDVNRMAELCDSQTGAVVVGHPNFFGMLEPMSEIAAMVSKVGSPLIQTFDPISLGLLRRPADYGADVAVAEGQSLGTPMSFGGPFLGLFACRNRFIRKLPGRVVGETVDRRGNRCFVLTLQTREQHIRRDKATSNICTNQGLIALRASVYLSLLGPQGLKETAEICYDRAHYAAETLAAVPGLKVKFTGDYFKEFVLETPGPAEAFLPQMTAAGFHAGVPLGRWFPGLSNCLLVAVTEKRTKTEIDELAAAWKSTLAS